MLKKQLGIIGLGKMGEGIALNLIDKNWNIVGYNRTTTVTQKLEKQGLIGAFSYPELTGMLDTPRTVWLMVSHQAVDSVVSELLPLLSNGDTIIDGGNSFYKDSIRRFQRAAQQKINYLDVGVSGGPAGARNGACLIVGGDEKVFQDHLQLFQDLAVANGYEYVGPSGAGHFVKMVHNGIEYGMMQSIAEGFNLMKESDFKLDLEKIADLYNHGSVISSRLIGWLQAAYHEHGLELEDVSGSVSHTGEGEWAVQTAKELNLPVTIMSESLEFRNQSANNPSYIGKILSALRNQFGGHDTDA